MIACPLCGQEDVIFTGQGKYEVEGRPTALCPHAEAHARAGAVARSVRFFADTGELLGPVRQSPWERIYAAGVPMGIEEEGRRFGAPFLFEICGIRGLRKEAVFKLGADAELVPLLPKLRVMESSEREGWPILMAPLYTAEGLAGIELRYFAPKSSPRPGEMPSKGPGRVIRTVGQRGIYFTDPFASPRAVVVFEGIWDAVAARWDAFERESGEFVFAGITANTSGTVIRSALTTHFPGVPVVVVGDRDRAGVQAMARLRQSFPTALLQGLFDAGGKGPKDYRDADPERRWQALLTGVEAGLEEWDRRKLDGDPDGRPMIVIRPPEHEMESQSWQALMRRGEVFLRGDQMVHVVRSSASPRGPIRTPSGSPLMNEANLYWLRNELSRAARFVRETPEGMTRASMVPDWLPQLLLASCPASGLPRLQALVEVPVFLPDGNLLVEPGLDLESGLFYAPMAETPEVPLHPTLEEAQAAAERLLELVADFPFANQPSPETHRAAWLAFLLTGFARFAIDGPVPFVLIDANGPSAGKGLLAQMTGMIVLGRPLSVGIAPKDGEELMKFALASLREGHRIFFLDEVPNPFGSREWNGLITAHPHFQGRMLGQNTLIHVPQLTLWVVAGNNVGLASDAARRCLHIRLEPMQERPEDRGGFRIPNLLSYVGVHQAELAAAALTILRAFHAAGRPSFGLTPWGSFEEWSSLVRNAVCWVTGVDCDTRQALADRADTARQAWGVALASMREAFGPRPFAVEQIIALCEGTSPLGAGLRESLEMLNTNPNGLCPKSLGWILHRHEKTVSGDHYIERHTAKRNGSRLWIIQAAQSQRAQAS